MLLRDGALRWDADLDPFDGSHPAIYSACNSSDEIAIAANTYAEKLSDPRIYAELVGSLQKVARTFFVAHGVGCGSWDE